MTLISRGGQLLTANGALTTNEDCCCDGPCLCEVLNSYTTCQCISENFGATEDQPDTQLVLSMSMTSYAVRWAPPGEPVVNCTLVDLLDPSGTYILTCPSTNIRRLGIKFACTQTWSGVDFDVYVFTYLHISLQYGATGFVGVYNGAIAYAAGTDINALYGYVDGSFVDITATQVPQGGVSTPLVLTTGSYGSPTITVRWKYAWTRSISIGSPANLTHWVYVIGDGCTEECNETKNVSRCYTTGSESQGTSSTIPGITPNGSGIGTDDNGADMQGSSLTIAVLG